MLIHFLTFLQMGYVAAAPSLSNRQRFKSYYRTYPSDAIFVPALVSFIRYYQWKKICIITENANTFISVSSNRSMACSSTSVISPETASSLALFDASIWCLRLFDTVWCTPACGLLGCLRCSQAPSWLCLLATCTPQRGDIVKALMHASMFCVYSYLN